MNGKVAKRLRKQHNSSDVIYAEHNKHKKIIKDLSTIVSTIKLDSNCGRKKYKEAKNEYKSTK